MLPASTSREQDAPTTFKNDGCQNRCSLIDFWRSPATSKDSNLCSSSHINIAVLTSISYTYMGWIPARSRYYKSTLYCIQLRTNIFLKNIVLRATKISIFFCLSKK
jgi:hypothetical protein